jgi:hypothetical protein
LTHIFAHASSRARAARAHARRGSDAKHVTNDPAIRARSAPPIPGTLIPAAQRPSWSGLPAPSHRRDRKMTVKNAAANVLAAVNVMHHAKSACARLDPLSHPLTLLELRQRAEMIDKVIRARSKLQQLRNRAAMLEDALARFKARREAKVA